MLQIEGVSRDFAGVTALDAVGFGVEQGEITALIGPNGAGKTTLINIITGVLPPSRGDIVFRGASLLGRTPMGVAALGMRRTFQTVRLLPGLTVIENLIVAQFRETTRTRSWRALLPAAASTADSDAATALLDRFGLLSQADIVANELPYGVQRRVEIARALAGNPSLVLLDEPAAGMNEAETDRLRDDILAIRASGVTVLLVEHDMSLVMSVADRIVFLDFGRKIAEGPPDAIRRDPAVIKSYLGH